VHTSYQLFEHVSWVGDTLSTQLLRGTLLQFPTVPLEESFEISRSPIFHKAS
jgi:hypothetical protein